ncbi:MAG: hypothetical protein KGI08_01925 [Thaumarchaeota archaeon]|nr:hypothetical protein [Nitrososphaerota archaeon]
MSRANAIIIVALSVITLLWVMKYALEYSYSTQGITLEALTEQVQALKNENIQLRAKVLQKESLTTIAREAKQMGFIDIGNNVIYIK